MNNTKLAQERLIIIPPQPVRFSLTEWELNTRTNTRYALDQQQLSERILVESDRLCDKSRESADVNKHETNRMIEERINEIEFRKNETEITRKGIEMEVEALLTYKERIMDAMAYIKSEALRIGKTCLMLRDGRIGIDLVHDDCDREMLKEIDIIEGAQIMLQRVLEQTHEQVRRLRSTLYFMDRELDSKTDVLKVDKQLVLLTENCLNLSIYHGTTPLASSNITLEEWESKTTESAEKAIKEKNAGLQLRVYVDILLKQITEDLYNQYHIVNESFERRIKETKTAKMKLELQHQETIRQVNEMRRNITRLEVEVAKKEGFMALAHTRLGFRAQREGIELCRDKVEIQLVNELTELNENVATLQIMLNEAHASLRYLLKTQVQLEEDINVKTNTLKIDEVDCMTMRQSIVFHSY